MTAGRNERHARRGAWRALSVVLPMLLLVGSGSPALADPAGPTHYDSRITGVEAEDGDPVPVELEILGGDSFLVVRAQPGTSVEVPGYEDEPYVRIAADGTVEVNLRSPSRWLNDARYGAADVDVPPDADADAPPSWETVADDGEYAWHDHRIHWMSPSVPRQVDPGAGTPQPVADWTVPLLVDGRDVTVSGELLWLPGPSPVVPVALVALALLAAVGLVLTRADQVPAVAASVALVALATGLSKNLGLPAGADGEPFLVVLPALALAVVAIGLIVHRRDDTDSVRGRLIAAAAGVPLLVWAIVQAGALTRPVVPGPLPVGGARIVVALAVAAGLAGLVTAARQVLQATSLDRDGATSTG